MNSIPQRAVGAEASAIYVEPQAHGLELRPQVDGVLREVMDVPPKLQSEVLARLEILSSLDIAEKRLPRMHATPSGFVGRRWISGSPPCRQSSGRRWC